MKNLCLFVWLLFGTVHLFSQGVVNSYSAITAINYCTNAVTVTNAGAFAINNRVLIIQMKGVDIDQSNSTAFGTVTNYNQAGNYEFATIASVSGNNITFTNTLLNSYTASGIVQLVLVPQYTNLTVTTPITGQPWNGSTGGVIVIEASGSITLNADIDGSDQGFRAGIVSLNQGYLCDQMDYFYDITSPHGGRKGEGIFELPNNIINGRGKNANGGGGGNNTNSGGAGGSNGGTGGRGGNQWGGCANLPIGGDGAMALAYSNTANKIFVGGGAGGGHQNNAVATAGTNGGGIVILRTPQLVANGGDIKSFTLDAVGSNGDGSGGGGGGGTVLITAGTITGNLVVDVHGGKGGDNTGHGPGGGGGGGVVWSATPLPGNVTVINSGGTPGLSSSYPPFHQASSGQAGITLSGLAIPEGNAVFTPLATPAVTTNSPVCQGQNIQFTLSGNYTGTTAFSWSGPAAFVSAQRNPQITNVTSSNSGSYKVVVSDNGCSDSTTVMVTVNPTYSATVNPTICSGNTYTLPRGTLVSNNGTYRDTLPTIAGCDSIIITILTLTPSPVVTLGNDTALCAGETLLLNAGNAGAAYLWQNGSTTSTLTVNTGGVYWVAVTQNSCTDSDTISINYNALPIVILGNDTTLCGGQTLMLNAGNAGANYLWQDGTVAATYTVTSAGQYWVQVTQNGCSTADTINFAYNPLPVVKLGNDTALCTAQSLLLDAANSGASFLWQDATTGSTFSVTGAGSYWVQVSQSGCSASDTINVTYNPVPVVFLGNDTAVCFGQTVALSAGNPGSTYLWQNGSTGQALTATTAGTYSVLVTLANCTTGDAVTITNLTTPVVNLGADTSLCSAQTLLLDAGNTGATYAWNDGTSLQTLSVTSAGTYNVTVTQTGCSATDGLTISYGAPPVFNLGKDATACYNEQVVLKLPAYLGNFSWSTGSSDSSITVVMDGNYRVTVSNICGSNSDSVNIAFRNCACNMLVPTAFSPNGDGANDRFKAIGTCPLKQFLITIYNRWGELVYSSNDITDSWDGTFKGMNGPISSFAWTIEYTWRDEGKKEVLAGNVTLVR